MPRDNSTRKAWNAKGEGANKRERKREREEKIVINYRKLNFRQSTTRNAINIFSPLALPRPSSPRLPLPLPSCPSPARSFIGKESGRYYTRDDNKFGKNINEISVAVKYDASIVFIKILHEGWLVSLFSPSMGLIWIVIDLLSSSL